MPEVTLVLSDNEMKQLNDRLQARGSTLHELMKRDVRAALVKKLLQATEAWAPAHRWEELVIGRNCPICEDLLADPEQSEEGYKVCDLAASRLRLMRNQFVRGYCVLTSLRHVREFYDLPRDEALKYFDDLNRVGRSLELLFKPAKINFEILGNSVPHLHCHIKPRYIGDIAPGTVIDQNAGVHHLSESEYESVCKELRRMLRCLPSTPMRQNERLGEGRISGSS